MERAASSEGGGSDGNNEKLLRLSRPCQTYTTEWVSMCTRTLFLIDDKPWETEESELKCGQSGDEHHTPKQTLCFLVSKSDQQAQEDMARFGGLYTLQKQ